jgi:quinoprotein dehydrogenase-associated probable ABC transporter substrate-binding protein
MSVVRNIIYRPGVRAVALAACAGALVAVAQPAAAAAQQSSADTQTLRVCQDPDNLPFSNTKGEGFENRIAELFGERLGWRVEYYSFPQRLGFIRNTLRFRLPGQAYACDVVMGVPARYEQASPTQPYYRSTYALVLPSGRGLDRVDSAEAFLALPRATLEKLRIGVYDRSPASTWLARHRLVEQGVPYRILNADPEHYPGEIIERDLASGKLDAAIVWGPIAGFFTKRIPDASLRVIPLASEPGVQLDYEISMGVRHGEREWKQTLERLIAENRPQIEAILREYNVPLLEPTGRSNP